MRSADNSEGGKPMTKPATYQMMDELHQALIDYYGGEFNYLMAIMKQRVQIQQRQVGMMIISTLRDVVRAIAP
jgi:hypothetical protein